MPESVKLLNEDINLYQDGSSMKAVLRLHSRDDKMAVLGRNDRYF